MLTTRTLDIDSLPFFENDKAKLRTIVEYIKKSHIFNNLDIYIFGSYVKGYIKDSSDIDILILTKENDKRNIRKFKLSIIDNLADNLDIDYGEDYDLMIYNKKDFLRFLEKSNSFESVINSYMCLIERG